MELLTNSINKNYLELTIPYSKISRFLFTAVRRASLDCTYNFCQRIMIPCSKSSFREWSAIIGQI